MRSQFLVAFALVAGQSVFAQQVVQQPVVGVMSVNTSVTVPDRGSAFLGGVSSAQSGRTQYGPLRSGTSTGLTRQSSSISTSVYIHDFRAMDEALLTSQPASSDDRRMRSGPAVRRDRESTPNVVVVSPLEKMAKFEELARNADKAGKAGVAKLHWQMAAKYGSKTAEKRLAELTQPSSPAFTRVAKGE